MRAILKNDQYLRLYDYVESSVTKLKTCHGELETCHGGIWPIANGHGKSDLPLETFCDDVTMAA